MGKKQKYLNNVASSVLGQIGGITYGGSYQPDAEDYPQAIWNDYGVKIIGIVHRIDPSARGRIAACGVVPNDPSGSVSYRVIKSGFKETLDGNWALTIFASQVITATIVDILRAEVRKMRDERWENELMQEEGSGHLRLHGRLTFVSGESGRALLLPSPLY